MVLWFTLVAGNFPLAIGVINPDQDSGSPIVLLGSWCIRGTAKSHPDRDSLVPLTHQDPSDLRSLNPDLIIQKE